MGLLNDTKNRKKMSALLIQHSQKLIIFSFLCGLVWFSLLASDVFNNKTYFSENALLPGLVVREFNPRSSLKRLLESLKDEAKSHPSTMPSAWIQAHFRQIGLDVYQNNFSVQYPFGSKFITKGNNLYAILRAPKVASTEALVISTPYRDFDSIHKDTLASIALMIELAAAFRRHAYWSKDIIFLITEYEMLGFQAWLDAYHGLSTSEYITSEKLKGTSGLIQGVINLEISSDKIYNIDIKIEGLHGQLPNLDLFNLAVELCTREQVVATFQSESYSYPSKSLTWKNWERNFKTMARMILIQATGLPTGGHGLFHRFGIQALTLKSMENQSHDYNTVTLIQIGRVLEGVVRSLNNLLEKFHQSFFFYLLPSVRNYVSIGLYMPPFALIAIPVLIKALYLYLKIQNCNSNQEICPRFSDINYWVACDIFTLHLFCGMLMHLIPMHIDYVKDYLPFSTEDSLYFCHVLLCFLWFVLTYCYNANCNLSQKELSYKMCLILLMLGGFMFTLALVNISFSLLFTILYVPISISLQYRGRFSFIQCFYLLIINPFIFTYLVIVLQSYIMDSDIAIWTHFVRAINGHKKLILFTVEDMYFFNNWNYKIVTLIIFPLWFNLWSLKVVNIK